MVPEFIVAYEGFETSAISYKSINNLLKTNAKNNVLQIHNHYIDG